MTIRSSLRLTILSVALLLSVGVARAEDRPASPRGQASTQVLAKAPDPKDAGKGFEGGKWIEVDYGRPILRNRGNIFGAGADYGKTVNAEAPVWRAGANATTRLTTEVPLMIGGKRVAAGKYDLFVELKEGAWTLIVSTQPALDNYSPKAKDKIWGAYGYDTKFDVVRAPMTMSKSEHSIDQLTFGFVDMTPRSGKLQLGWEHAVATVPFTVVD